MVSQNDTDQYDPNQWFVYSDTDAYIASFRTLREKLDHIPPDVHLVFQNGRWLLNSGFQAWRNTRESRAMLAQWEKLYTPSKDFFAEQNALYAVYKRNKKLCLYKSNGFLGWHIKGKIPFKVELSTIGRRFANRSGPALFITILLTLSFMFIISILPTCVADLPHHYHPQRDKQKKAHHDDQQLQLQQRWKIQATYIHVYKAVTSKPALVLYVLFISSVLLMLLPTGRKKSGAEFSKWDYYHVLPHGRVMLKTNSRFWSDAFGHLQGKGVRWRFYHRHLQSTWKVFTIFIVAECIEWSGLLWIYPILCYVRWGKHSWKKVG